MSKKKQELSLEPIFYVYKQIRLGSYRSSDEEPFNIGKGHGDRAWDTSGRNDHWKKVVKKRGFRYILIEQGLTEQQALDREVYWIAYYKERDCAECNKTIGGEGVSGYRHTDEAKQKMSLSGKGKKKPDSMRKKTSERMRNRIVTSETLKRMSEANLGKKQSEETKKKQQIASTQIAIEKGTKPFLVINENDGSIVGEGIAINEVAKRLNFEHRCIQRCLTGKRKHHKGHLFIYKDICTPELIEERINQIKNYKKPPVSEETRQKISKINKGKEVSIETRVKISESNSGKPKSLEHKKKLSEANIGKFRTKEENMRRGKIQSQKHVGKCVVILNPDGSFNCETVNYYQKSLELNLCPSSVCQCLKKKAKHVKYYTFMYKDEYLALQEFRKQKEEAIKLISLLKYLISIKSGT
jgi:group I intron endonuclease